MTSDSFPWPPDDPRIREALADAFESGDWGRYQGERCDQLRAALAELHGVRHAQLTCSGTIAVELALRAVGVESGDEVVLAAYDFPGNFRAIEAIGARPVLVDVESGGWVLDLGALEQIAAGDGLKNVTAVVVSHLHGQLAPMERLMTLAEKHGWSVVEDACQTPGAIVDGRPAGGWGDAGVMSFGGSKLLTAGRGGALLTSEALIAQRARIHANRGNDAFAMSELQAAVLLPQLETLEERNNHRAAAAKRLRQEVAGFADSLAAPITRPGDTTCYYKLGWLLRDERLRSTREGLTAALQAEGAPIFMGFDGFSRRSERRCRKATAVPNSEAAASATLLLHHPALLAPDSALDEIALAIRKVLAHHLAR